MVQLFENVHFERKKKYDFKSCVKSFKNAIEHLVQSCKKNVVVVKKKKCENIVFWQLRKEKYNRHELQFENTFSPIYLKKGNFLKNIMLNTFFFFFNIFI